MFGIRGLFDVVLIEIININRGSNMSTKFTLNDLFKQLCGSHKLSIKNITPGIGLKRTATAVVSDMLIIRYEYDLGGTAIHSIPTWPLAGAFFLPSNLTIN
jgi:hypothetical protein